MIMLKSLFNGIGALRHIHGMISRMQRVYSGDIF